jgi:hypothetical protein
MVIHTAITGLGRVNWFRIWWSQIQMWLLRDDGVPVGKGTLNKDLEEI